MTETKPLVSIGLPVYNGARYARRALDQLLAQDYENFELIISDNASTDETWEICSEYAARDSRIRLYANERNLGARSNFEIVLRLARGRYFMWAGIDDGWQASFVQTLVDELERHADAGVAMSAIELVDDDRLPVNIVRFEGADNPNRKSYQQMFWAICSPFKKKYNLYIYGLFRTELVRKTFPRLPPEPNIDRIFVGLIALVTRFRYVEQVLFTRQLRKDSTRTEKKGQLSDTEKIRSLGSVILRSPLVPWYRKLYAPVGMMGLLMWMMRSRFNQSAFRAKLSYYRHLHKRQSNAN